MKKIQRGFSIKEIKFQTSLKLLESQTGQIFKIIERFIDFLPCLEVINFCPETIGCFGVAPDDRKSFSNQDNTSKIKR
jgi:hypothetical protein